MTEPPPTNLSPQHAAYERIARDDRFAELRKRYLSFVVPATVVFMLWYVLYVICNNWARGFMNTVVVGNINIALIFGLLQFVSTFLIAWLYSRYANRKLDVLASELGAEFEQEVTR